MNAYPRDKAKILEVINSQLKLNIEFQDKLFEHWLQTLPTANLASSPVCANDYTDSHKIIWSSEVSKLAG